MTFLGARGTWFCRWRPPAGCVQLRTLGFPILDAGFSFPYKTSPRSAGFCLPAPGAHQSGGDWLIISSSLLPRSLSCLVNSENGTCSQSKTFQMSPKSLKCALSEFFKAAFWLNGSLGSGSLYIHRSHWHLPPGSLFFKVSISSFGLAFELGLISHMNQEDMLEKKFVFLKG